jgi:branched-chain amino acid transport system substrate-binding protein
MNASPFCLIAVFAAASAAAAPATDGAGACAAGGPDSPMASAPKAAPAPVGAMPAPSRFVHSTPGEEYPPYGELPKELWPFSSVEPFYRYFVTRMPFRGPGRDYPPPPDLKSLPIGLVDAPRGGPNWDRSVRTREGIVLAIEEANQERRPGELPFDLIEHEGIAQWGGAANLAAQLADEKVLGYLGTIDGTDAHVALRVTLKTEIVMVNTSDPDQTLTETQIPWLIRVLPDHRQEEGRLAELIVRKCGCNRIAVLRTGDRFARVGAHQFMDFARRLGCPAVQELLFAPGAANISYQIGAIKESQPDAIFLMGEPADIGRFAKQIRQAGITARFFGTDLMMEDAFLKSAGDAAEGTTFTFYFDPSRQDPLWTGFVARYKQRWGHEPDAYAGYAYDGAQICSTPCRSRGPTGGASGTRCTIWTITRESPAG